MWTQMNSPVHGERFSDNAKSVEQRTQQKKPAPTLNSYSHGKNATRHQQPLIFLRTSTSIGLNFLLVLTIMITEIMYKNTRIAVTMSRPLDDEQRQDLSEV